MVSPSNLRPDLPPAYGSLDEEDLSPYDLHKDSGALTLATIKRTLRDRFAQDVRRGGNCGLGSRFSIEASASDGVKTFHQTSCALYRTVCGINAMIERRPSAQNFYIDFNSKGSAVRTPSRWSFLAARLANMVLELGWRMVALNEVRPAMRCFSARALSVLQTMYSHIDEVLLQALRHWNGDGAANSTRQRSRAHREPRAEEFQVYLSQLVALDAKIRQLLYCAHYNKDVLVKSISFLQEAVEVERMQQANWSPERDVARRSRDPSVVSSVGDISNRAREDETSRA